MPTPEQVLAGYDSAVDAVRRAVLIYVETAWRAPGSYREADIDRLVAMIVPRVQAGQIRIANLTSAYIAAMTGGAAIPVDAALVTGGRGVPPAEVYRRSGVTVWTALSEGLDLADAISQGQNRLTSIASTDLQMAKVRQSRESMVGDPRVVGYRRVVHGDTCALCMIASTQRYHHKDLLPIHPACNCSVNPLIGTEGTYQVIDESRLQAVHDAVAQATGISDPGGRAIDYRKLVVTREHGDIGPVLTWKSHNFTGANDL